MAVPRSFIHEHRRRSHFLAVAGDAAVNVRVRVLRGHVFLRLSGTYLRENGRVPR